MELSPLNLLKVATAIIENEQLNIEVSLSILREIHKLIKVESLTGKEMTLYLHIYYTNLIEEFVKKACTL
jgi:DNA-directed RNA polymerase delta subunit